VRGSIGLTPRSRAPGNRHRTGAQRSALRDAGDRPGTPTAAEPAPGCRRTARSSPAAAPPAPTGAPTGRPRAPSPTRSCPEPTELHVVEPSRERTGRDAVGQQHREVAVRDDRLVVPQRDQPSVVVKHRAASATAASALMTTKLGLAPIHGVPDVNPHAAYDVPRCGWSTVASIFAACSRDSPSSPNRDTARGWSCCPSRGSSRPPEDPAASARTTP
jgi:hypothetical protein